MPWSRTLQEYQQMFQLEERDYQVTLQQTKYEFQRGGNQLLIIRKQGTPHGS